MKWQKPLKFVLAGLVVLFVLSVGSMIYFLQNLPSKGQIQQTMHEMTTKPMPAQAPLDVKDADPMPLVEGASQATAPVETAPIDQVEKKNADAAFLALAHEDQRSIEVCKNLSKAKDFQTLTEAPNAVDDFLKNIETENPYLRTIRPAAKYILQRPLMKSLVEEIKEKENQNQKESLVDKSRFYFKAARAVQEIVGEQKRVELLADRSMHLYVLSVLAKAHPEITTRPEVLDFCDSIEAKLGQSDTENIDSEREDLLALIKEVGSTPEQLKFDPKRRAHMNIKLNPRDLQIGLDFQLPTQVIR